METRTEREALDSTETTDTTWQTVLASVQTISELLETCKDAFAEEDGKPKVSATTKKRLAARALQGLQSGCQLVQGLESSIQQLQRQSEARGQQLEQAAASHQHLEVQLHSSDREAHDSKRAMLRAEAGHAAVVQQMQQLKQQLDAATAEKQGLEGTIDRLESELLVAAGRAQDAAVHLAELQAQVDQLAAAARDAEAGAEAAAGALHAAHEVADKERRFRLRHEDAVARLTADNLVFMAKLRAAEAAEAAAAAERDELRIALEQHKGPWLDEVHQGVEARVKAAMARAEQLEAELQLQAAQHAQHLVQLQQQQTDLEAALQAAHKEGAELTKQLKAAQAAAGDARVAAEEAAVLAADAQAAADARAADLRVAQESLRTMREECNERWMSERSARVQLSEAEEQQAEAQARTVKLKKTVAALSDDLATQRAVNQQLMMKKEEVEWQLLAAIAQLQGQQGAAASGASGSQATSSPQQSLEASSHHHQQQQQQQNASGASLSAGSGISPAGHAPELAPAGSLTAHMLHSPFGASAAQAAPSPTQALRPPLPPEVPGPAAVAAGRALWQLPSSSFSNNSHERIVSAGSLQPSVFESAPVGVAVALPAGLKANGSLTAAGAGAAGGLRSGGSSSSCRLAHAFSAPEGDMFTLPSFSFGLATLPTPQQMLAAAAAAAAASGSAGLAPAGSLGRVGSLNVPAGPAAAGASAADAGPASEPAGHTSCSSAAAAAATGQPGSAGTSNSGGGSSVPNQAAIDASSSPLAAAAAAPSAAGRAAAGGGGGGSLQGGLQPRPQPMVLGATGGLMAPFSPLSPGPKRAAGGLGSVGPVGVGAVFPECITASAVTDAEQADLLSFSFPASVSGNLQQQQQQPQQALGPGFWYLQQQQQQQQPPQQQCELPPYPAAMAAGGVSRLHASSNSSSESVHSNGSSSGDGGNVQNRSSSPGNSSSGSRGDEDEHQAGSHHRQHTKASVHQQHRHHHHPASDDHHRLDATAAAAAEASSNNSDDLGSSSGSQGHLHGILINGPNSRPRSPAALGVSPTGSMKSVRFSFEGLDRCGDGAVDHDQEHDQKQGQRRSSSSSISRLGGASPGRASQMQGHYGRGASSSEWLRHALYDQLTGQQQQHNSSGGGSGGHSPSLPPHYHAPKHHHHHHSPYHQQHHQLQQQQHGADSYSPRSSGGSTSRQHRDLQAASHPPAPGARGSFYLGRFAAERHSQQDLLRLRQQRQQQAAKEAAAFAAAAADPSQPKRAPVHPVFGAMRLPAESSSSSGAAATAGGGRAET